MPLYTYACESCDNVFDDLQSISNREKPCETPCQKCGGKIFKTVTPIKIVAGSGGLKVPDGFKDVLKHMHANCPGSTLDKTSSALNS